MAMQYTDSGSRRIRGRLRFPAAESSIHASGVSAATVSDRVMHAETSKMKILGAGHWGISDAGYDTAPRAFKGQWHG